MNDLAPTALLNREGNLLLFTAYYESVHRLHSLFGIAPWILYKAVNSLCILLIGREVWLYAKTVFNWPNSASAWSVAMCWVFPVWSMLFTSVQMVAIFVFLVLCGHRLIHSNSWKWQVVGWLALFFSFHLNANFAFVFGLELMRWLLRDKAVAWSWIRSTAVMSLSVVTYAFSRLMFSPGGEFVGYNALLNLRSLPALGVLAIGILKFATFLLIPIVAWSVGRMLAIAQTGVTGASRVAGHATWVWMLAFLALFFTAIIPYSAVGKSTALFFTAFSGTSSSFAAIRLAMGDSGLMSPWGIWSNRFALLLSVVCAWMVGLVVVWLNERSPKRLVFATGACAWLVSAGLLMQAQGTKLDQLAQVPAIIAGLKAMPQPPGGMLDIEASPAQRFLFPEAHEPNWFAYRAWGKREWFTVFYYPDGASERVVRELAERHYRIRANNPIRAGIYLADEYAGPSCRTQIKLVLADVDRWDMLLLKGHREGSIAPAKVTSVQTQCPATSVPALARSYSAM